MDLSELRLMDAQHNSSTTGIVLTKNEELCLSRCLTSLKWCRELIVVDSGSTDNTVAIARSFGAKVYTHVQDGAFLIDQQRNWALQQVTTPWALFIDADEVVPLDLAEKIEAECGNPQNSNNGYELTPRFIFWGKWLRRTQGYPNWHPRLVRVGKASFSGGVWEHFNTRDGINRIHIPYDHYALANGISQWIVKHDRYSNWESQNVLAFLETRNTASFKTTRNLVLRMLAAKFWPLRCFFRPFYMYVIRLGFLEGVPAFVFALLYFTYELMIVIKVAELKRIKKHRNYSGCFFDRR